MMSKTIRLDPINPQQDLIIETARVIKKGGVVAFPTKYLYGLGADAFNSNAVDKVFEIKQRPYNKPLLLLINKKNDLNKLVRGVPLAAQRIIEYFWPGEITIVFESLDTLPPKLTAGTGKIGVRMPEHPVALSLTNAVKGPITATSANITGDRGCSRVLEMDSLIVNKLDLILDVGPLKGGIGSTVIDVAADPPKILREGAVPAKDIFAVIG